MTDFEQTLIDRGLDPDDISFIVDLIEARNNDAIQCAASRLLCLIFLRVEKDSAAGCALRRALGFSGGVSLSRAARDFLVSKQYLEDLQAKLEGQLGPLSFLARQAREADDPTPPPPLEAGPPGDSSLHR